MPRSLHVDRRQPPTAASACTHIRMVSRVTVYSTKSYVAEEASFWDDSPVAFNGYPLGALLAPDDKQSVEEMKLVPVTSDAPPHQASGVSGGALRKTKARL